MKINDLLISLEEAIKNNDNKEIEKIKHEIIHPSCGAYFAVFFRINNTLGQTTKWIMKNEIFENKEDAINALKKYRQYCLDVHLPYNDFTIKRIAVHETDITNYL